jgi:site-specific DNA recombinase
MTKTEKQSAAVCYIRISSEEQLKKSATNITTQTRKCSDACQRAGAEVAKVFVDEGESAFKQAYTQRPQLQAMLAYLREHKEVTHVVFENLSRLARQGPEQAMLLAHFKSAGLQYISVDEPNAESNTAAGRMAVSIIGVLNEYSSDSLSERVAGRMQAGALAGRHLHLARLGYLNGKVNGAKNIVPDPERAELVRKAFELVAEGRTLSNVLRIVTSLGLRSRAGQPLKKNTLSQMLRCRIYCGWVKSGPVTARGTFEPLVTEELWERCQDFLAGRAKRKEHRQQHDDWPLRRFVICDACGKRMTSGWVKNRLGKRYGFYFCEQKGCRANSVRKEALEREWVILLSMLEPQEELLRRVPEMAAAAWEHRKGRSEEEQRQLTSRLSDQQALNKKAIEARVQGSISDEDFATMKKSIADQISILEHGLQELAQERSTMQDLMKTAEIRVQNLAKHWEGADLKERMELQFSLWPEGLRWSEENHFLNTGNASLLQAVDELMGELVGGGGRPRT